MQLVTPEQQNKAGRFIERRARSEFALTSILSAAAGAIIALVAWYPGHWLAALLALPLIWGRSSSRLPAFVLWCGYYLAGARDIPAMTESFFAGYGELSAGAALAMGIAFWLGQAALLAAPWGVLHTSGKATPLSRGWRAILATIAVSIPPLGVIGWISPAHTASALYPGWQGFGLALGVMTIATAASATRSKSTIVLGASLCVASLTAHVRFSQPASPSQWVAISSNLGKFPDGGFDDMYQRTQALQGAADHDFAAGAKVVILPEETLGTWRPAVRYWWTQYLERLELEGKTIVIGVDLKASDRPLRYTDSAVIAGAGRGRFDSRIPMPIGSWRPGARVSTVLGTLGQPYLNIDGKVAAFSICYEDMLLWPHWRLWVTKPDVLIGMASNWFIAGRDLDHIQAQSATSIARLAGIPLMRAVNR